MKIVFMGTPEAAVPSLKRLVMDGHDVVEVWTQPDRPSGRGRKMTSPPVKVCAEELGIPVFQPVKIKSKETRQRFVSLSADVAVVVAYGRILSKTYLEAYPLGCINVHFSLLPKYRGAAPVNWAIANGEEVTGVTTMQMDRGLDTGDILMTRETEIGPFETSPELMERLSSTGAHLLSETLGSYKELVPRKQIENEATFAPLFTKVDGKIDWNKRAIEIANQIRGFQPFPKSFSTINGEQVTFWKANASEMRSNKRAGTVIPAETGGLLVSCGEGTVLEIESLQLAGKSRTSARDILNSDKVKVGDVFGDEE